MASEYGWEVDYILDLPVRQVVRLNEAIAERRFTSGILSAELQEVAVARVLASAFGDTSPPPWPTWEEQKQRAEVDIGPLAKFRDKALGR